MATLKLPPKPARASADRRQDKRSPVRGISSAGRHLHQQAEKQQREAGPARGRPDPGRPPRGERPAFGGPRREGEGPRGPRPERGPAPGGWRDERPRPDARGERGERGERPRVGAPRPDGPGFRPGPRAEEAGFRPGPRPEGGGFRPGPRPDGPGVRQDPRPPGHGLRPGPRPDGGGFREPARQGGGGVRPGPGPQAGGWRELPRRDGGGAHWDDRRGGGPGGRADGQGGFGGDRPRFGGQGGHGGDRPRFGGPGGPGADRPRAGHPSGRGDDRPRGPRPEPAFRRGVEGPDERPRFGPRSDPRGGPQARGPGPRVGPRGPGSEGGGERFGGERGPRREGGFRHEDPRASGQDRPRLGGHGGDRPRLGGPGRPDGDRPRFAPPDGRGGDRPRWGRQAGPGGDHPRFGGPRSPGDDGPRFGGQDRPHGDRPRVGNPGGAGDDRPRFGGHDGHAADRPRFGGPGGDRPRVDDRGPHEGGPRRGPQGGLARPGWAAPPAPARGGFGRPAARDEDEDDEAPVHAPGSLRLSKRLAELGHASRREADDWIAAGWVKVDGQVVDTLGARVLPHQQVEIDPRARELQSRQVTVLLHKPVGLVSGQAEDGHQPAITLVTPENRWGADASGIDWQAHHLRHLAVAGRLDVDSSGLLVLTQDGRIARTLIGEREEDDDNGVEKEYLVEVAWFERPELGEGADLKTLFPEDRVLSLRHGLSLDGKALRPARVSWQNETTLRFVLREGRKRQIRRMCELVGLKVLSLRRVRIGRVALASLPPGQWRYLAPWEKFD